MTITNRNPAALAAKKDELVEILQSQSNLVVNIDRLAPAMELYNNGTCCKSKDKGTDVYFHVTDPVSNRILGFNDDKVQK